MHSTYEIRTQDGYHVVSIDGDPVARVMTSHPISATTDAWPTAYAVCSEAGLPKPKWVMYADEVIYLRFTEKQ